MNSINENKKNNQSYNFGGIMKKIKTKLFAYTKSKQNENDVDGISRGKH